MKKSHAERSRLSRCLPVAHPLVTDCLSIPTALLEIDPAPKRYVSLLRARRASQIVFSA
jgi:hypothetical protein